jgi:hypothetical protein
VFTGLETVWVTVDKVNSELVSSVKEVLSDFKKSMSVDLATISSRISSLEAGHRVSLPTPCEEVSDLISMAHWSLEDTEESSASDSLGEPTSVDVIDLVRPAKGTLSETH